MISLIAALSENFVIGKNNKLIWHLPTDLKRFKKLTTNKTIVMGRKTFESLPGLLPNRKHIVITSNENYKPEKVEIVHRPEDILKYKTSEEEVFIIGGGQIYNEFISHCSKLYLTIIHSNITGDTYFPHFNKDEYNILEEEKHNENNMNFSFLTLEKKYIDEQPRNLKLIIPSISK